jgi:hypothetical protein
MMSGMALSLLLLATAETDVAIDTGAAENNAADTVVIDSLAADSLGTANSGPGSLVARLLPAESPALRERLLHPHRLFVWDGAETVGPGDVFYASLEWTRRLMWAGPFDPAAEWQVLGDAWAGDDSLSVGFRSQGGAEAGDGLYREMQGQSRPEDNRTPAYRIEGKAAVTSQLRLRALLDQNDVATYRTFGGRADQLEGSGHWGDFALQGENLPTRSLAFGAIDYEQRIGHLGAAFARGWRWSLSPITGTYHPWLFTLTRLTADWSEHTGLYFSLGQWQSPEGVANPEGEGTLSEVGLRLHGGGMGWAWRLQWGVQRRQLETWEGADDSARTSGFADMDDERFPFVLAAQRRFTFEDAPSLEWRTDLKAASQDGLLTLQGQSQFLRKTGAHRPEASLQGYFAYRTADATVAYEFLEGGSGAFLPERTARGGAALVGYAWVKGPETLSLKGHVATDWGRPVFQGDWVADTFTRTGAYVGSEHALHNFGMTASAVTTRMPRLRLAALGAWRTFAGQEADNLEYEPSPYWLGGELSTALKTDLSGIALLRFVGPKTVRGFSEKAWRTEPHLEAHFGLRQAFWHDRLAAHAQMLHAFAEERLEHPFGNPVRFRVLVGLDGRW